MYVNGCGRVMQELEAGACAHMCGSNPVQWMDHVLDGSCKIDGGRRLDTHT